MDTPTSSSATTSVTESSDKKDWWETATIYQIYPRSFMDANGDGIGDLQGITKKMMYFKEIGVDAIWLSPIMASPQVDLGYDISDYKQIHPEYGTMDDFTALIAKADSLNIKVILDFVPNHTSDQHDWFQKSVKLHPYYHNFYVWRDPKYDEVTNERLPPNNWRSVFNGSAWTWNEKRGQYYLHQFSASQPDLNYRNQYVVETMDDVLLFWLRKGVAGFRVDAIIFLFEDKDLLDEPVNKLCDDPNLYDYTTHIHTTDQPETYQLVYRWRRLLDDFKWDQGGITRILMTEAYTDIKNTIRYSGTGDLQIKGSHIPFNFLFITDLNQNSTAYDFLFTINKWMSYTPTGNTLNWIMGNHDISRVATRFGRHRINGMNALLMTLPGVCVIYYGDEIGMEDHHDISWEETKDVLALSAGPEKYRKYSRDPSRTPFQWDDTKNAGFSIADDTWLPVNPDYIERNLKAQNIDTMSVFNFFLKLSKLRKESAFIEGTFRAFTCNDKVLVIIRDKLNEQIFTVTINLSDVQQTVDIFIRAPDIPSKMFVWTTTELNTYDTNLTMDMTKVALEPYGVVITSLTNV